MECKSLIALTMSQVLRELIDTLWNVNSKVFDEQVGQNIELIDTLWNVNYSNVISFIVSLLN